MSMKKNRTAIILFTRVPIPGETKTRLLSAYDPEVAADLHRFFIARSVSAIGEAQEKNTADIFVFHTPKKNKEILEEWIDSLHQKRSNEKKSLALPDDPSKKTQKKIRKKTRKAQRDPQNELEAENEIEAPDDLFADAADLYKRRWRYIPQEGNDLWEKMNHAFSFCFEQGYDQVILLGTDIPEIDGKDLIRAIRALHYTDLAIAPTFDNGYFLIGMRRHIPEVFLNINREDPDVFRASVEAIEKIASYTVLPKRYDMDTPQDLELLVERWKKGDDECRKNLDNILRIIGRI